MCERLCMSETLRTRETLRTCETLRTRETLRMSHRLGLRLTWLVGHGGGGGFVDQVTVAEAFDGERRVDGMRFVAGDGPGEHMRGARRGLEAAGAPAAIDVQTLDGRLGDDGRAIRRYIDDA